MKFKSKILILLSILLVVTIVRESGVIGFNFYKSTLTKSLEHHFDDNFTSFETKKSDFSSQFPNENFADRPINILDIDNKKVAESKNAFDITINKIDIPISIIPLYTNVDYEVVATINDKVSITRTDTTNLYLIDKNIKGNITLKGNLKAFGLLSNYEIKKLILADYKENLKKEFKDYLSS